MAQSYGNLSISTILAAGDEILGVDTITQTHGTSVSRASAVVSLAAATTLTMAVDGGVPVTLNLPVAVNPDAIAANIQAQARLAGVGVEYTAFKVYYKDGKYVLQSGTSEAVPVVAASAVVVTGGTAAPFLALGVAQGGTESTAAAPYIEYHVHYRFSFGGGRSFSSYDVVVLSSEMTLATSLVELQTIADGRASAIKRTLTAQPSASVSTDAINGTVSL